MRKQWTVEVVRCINEWANGGWDANEMTWKNPCTTNRVNQWINESMNRWTSESMNQWSKGSINQWSNEPTNHWIHEPMKRWANERTNEWMNEWMDGWMDGWVGGWMEHMELWMSELFLFRAISSLSDHTSYLSYYFSEQHLIWAASSQTLLRSCLPASFSVASATQFLSSQRLRCVQQPLATSSCNPA